MQVKMNESGYTLLRFSLKDWGKAAILLGACLWGHAKLQCAQIESVADSMRGMNSRLERQEDKLAAAVEDHRELKEDYKATTQELRDYLKELLLRQQASAAK